MKEQDIQNAILDYLHVHGAYAIRVNSGGKETVNAKGQRHYIRMAPAGTPDILAIWPGGLGLAIEVKMPGNKPTDKQAETLAMIREIGGLSIVAFSVDDVETAIMERINHDPA